MNDVDLMKVADLAAQLGRILGMNPVWKDNYVIYKTGLDDDYIQLTFDLENCRWGIATSDYFINLPKEAPDLIAGMSKLVKGEEVVRDQDDELTTSETGSSRVTLVDGRELEVEEDFDTVNVRWNAALRGENGTSVMSLTEKDSGWGLAVLAENIELVEEMR